LNSNSEAPAAATPNPAEEKPTIPVVVRISKRGGGEVPEKHAAVIGMAATLAMARMNAATPAEVSEIDRRTSGRWAQQGRSLVHASHNVARHKSHPLALVGQNSRAEIASAEGSAK
jgi:hypothetical protein